jgi:tetratricopeptide (TPR) repeat protein
MAAEERASPLETIADIFEKVDKYAGIIAAIIAALTFSQGNRVVSYAFVIIGYALMALFLWRVMTQRSVVRRVIATVRPLPEKREYVYPRSQRWVTGIALVVLTLFSFGWVGVNGWRDYQAKEGLLFPKAKENELLVITAQFDNRSTKGVDPTQRIYDRLCKELGEAGITNARLETAPEIADLNEAREIGERHGAIFVIWGWFDDVGLTPNFTIVKEEELVLKGMGLEEVSVEPLKDFGLYIREGLPAQMAYFSALTIGQVYFWDGKFQKGLSAFDRAIENAQQGGTSEGLATIYFYRGYIYDAILDDPKQAIADYDKAIELRSDLGEGYNNRGIAYAHKGDHDLAIADFDKAIELRPDHAHAYNNRGLAYHDKGEYGRAIADYDRAIELKLDYAEAYYNRGLAYYDKGEYDLAIADFDKAIEFRPNDAMAYSNRGLAYAYQGEHDLAIADFDKVIELKPDDAEAYVNRGTAYADKGDYDLAITDFDRAIGLKPDFAVAYYNRGNIYKHMHKYDLATADYARAIELRPDGANAFVNRGNIYAEQGDYDLAIADYDKAIELKPDLAEAYVNRGAAYADKGEYDQAITDYDRAIALKPDYAEAYVNCGNAYVGKGEYDLAIANYDKAIKLKPDLAEVYLFRGSVHRLMGEKNEAIRDFERFLELSEDEDLRREAEEHLRELKGE